MKSFTAKIMGLSKCNQNIDFIIFKAFKKLKYIFQRISSKNWFPKTLNKRPFKSISLFVVNIQLWLKRIAQCGTLSEGNDRREHWGYENTLLHISSDKFQFTPIFSRFFQPKFFWQFFSWNQSGQQLKSAEP